MKRETCLIWDKKQAEKQTCFSAETKPFLAVLTTAILQKPTRAAGEEKSLQTPVPHKLDLGAMEVS